MDESKIAQGQSINGCEDHWIAHCPICNKEYEFRGYFDPEDEWECFCGTWFRTEKVWLNNNVFIK